MSEQPITQEQIRANRAKEILNDPITKEAFDRTRESLVQAIEMGDLSHPEIGKSLMLSLQVLKEVKDQFIKVIETGQIDEWSFAQKQSLEDF